MVGGGLGTSTGPYGNNQGGSTAFSSTMQHYQVQVNGGSTMGRKKLPFGFQVQKEKRDLLKVTDGRGKSSQGPRHGPASNRALDEYARPESGNAGLRKKNLTYDLI